MAPNGGAYMAVEAPLPPPPKCSPPACPCFSSLPFPPFIPLDPPLPPPPCDNFRAIDNAPQMTLVDFQGVFVPIMPANAVPRLPVRTVKTPRNNCFANRIAHTKDTATPAPNLVNAHPITSVNRAQFCASRMTRMWSVGAKVSVRPSWSKGYHVPNVCVNLGSRAKRAAAKYAQLHQTGNATGQENV